MAHLRSKDAKSMAELRRTRTINKRLRSLLDANNITIPHDLEVVDSAISATTIEVIGAVGSLQRVQPSKPKAQAALDLAADLGDPQVAIEFILALEEPCLPDHHNHVGEDGEVGHSMLLQSSVLQYAPSTISTKLGNQFSQGSSWDVPRAQLEEQLSSLLNTSLKLNLKNEMTPIMCWNKVRERHETRPMSVAQFQKLQRALVDDMICYG